MGELGVAPYNLDGVVIVYILAGSPHESQHSLLILAGPGHGGARLICPRVGAGQLLGEREDLFVQVDEQALNHNAEPRPLLMVERRVRPQSEELPLQLI